MMVYMSYTNNNPLNSLARRLVQDGLILEITAKTAHAEAVAQHTPFIQYLVEQKLIAPALLARTIAYDFGLPLLDLQTFDLKHIPRNLVSEKFIRQHHILPLWHRGKQLFLAIADPTQQIVLNEIKFHTGLIINCVVVEENKLKQLIEQISSTQEMLSLDQLNNTALDELLHIEEKNITINSSDTEDAPIVRYVNKILLDTINKGASDIHFEPYEKHYRIRKRLDGVLYEIGSPSINLASRITARLKIMAQLDIAERRIPQDGRFKMQLPNKSAIDFRVSICPTIHGEKIVIRILDPNNTALLIESLGLENKQEDLLQSAITKPHGMILVTGPTGSGKTITLYTILNQLNTSNINISTVEDPVEIYLAGINQVNINPKAGLTFATVLRAFLRQDPDILMVGEMRDLETAEIGIQAAQTGHLVLSTLHTNSALETLTRLSNMGIPAYNIATSVSLIMAQRLARLLCGHCKETIVIPDEELLREGFIMNDLRDLTLYAPVGCEYCAHGYKGRIGIFEILPVTNTIGNIIMRNGNVLDITNQARMEGMCTLREAGLNKVKLGLTSLAEINRITKDS